MGRIVRFIKGMAFRFSDFLAALKPRLTILWAKSKIFLDSNFLQTVAVLFVGFLAFKVASQQNNINKQLTLLGNSPKYNNVIHFDVFESDLMIRNDGRISLHNVDSGFIDLYVTPNTREYFGSVEGTIYDFQPGEYSVIRIPSKFKIKGKVILVEVCYIFNDDPFDAVDSSISPWKLKDDPFYEVNRRFYAYDNHKCSSTIIKYIDESNAVILSNNK